MLIMFGIYSFNNPDDSNCWVNNVNDDVYSKKPADTEDYDLRDVKKDFRIIFICGFVMCIINLVYAFMGILYFMWDSKQILKFAQCLAFLSGLLYIGWIVYASIIIFSDASNACADSLLP